MTILTKLSGASIAAIAAANFVMAPLTVYANDQNDNKNNNKTQTECSNKNACPSKSNDSSNGCGQKNGCPCKSK